MPTATGFKKYVPNILSWFRIIGSFSLPFLAWKSWDKDLTLPLINNTFFKVPIVWIIVYVILAVSDKFDGTLARKLNAKSELGAALDVYGDAIVLVMGATLCFVHFVADSLETWQFRLYIGLMIFIVLGRAYVFIFSRIYHGKGNMLHSYFQKGFTIFCYIAIFFWAFLRTIPQWSIYFLVAISVYSIIDESIYIVRTEKYDVNFKGHGFEKYEKRRS